MSGKLCILSCRNFYREIAAAIAAEGWADVSAAAFPVRCGCPPVSWDELRPLVGEGCTQVVVIGRSCLHGLGQPPADWPPVRMLPSDECLSLVAPAALVAEAIARGAYLVTPNWLDDWRGSLRAMGFGEVSAAEFFRDSVHELLLLDTGVVEDAQHKLAGLAESVGLPATRLAVGIDYVRRLLGRLVAEWRLDEAVRQAGQRERDYARELADHKSAMDFLGQLPLLKDERESIAVIEEMFYLLFAPKVFHYVPCENGVLQVADALSPALAGQVRSLSGDWGWTTSETGFLLRVARAGELLGVVVVDQFTFPEYRNHYLNLALSIAGVAGLAIDNARTYRRLKELQSKLEQEARTDSLTGCANRRHFLEQAGSELARVRRHPEAASVLMLDLDHFKEINDRFGHHAGDLVLQRLVQVCQTTLREEDVVGRLGGEEFAVLLPATSPEKALEVANRLCRDVAAEEVTVDGMLPIRFTASIGVATMGPEDSSIGDLLGRADAALYEAKRAGRNRVVTA